MSLKPGPKPQQFGCSTFGEMASREIMKIPGLTAIFAKRGSASSDRRRRPESRVRAGKVPQEFVGGLRIDRS
jgi:hypothetical protein